MPLPQTPGTPAVEDVVAIPAPRRRVLAYDALRTFAIVSVVGIHSLMTLRGQIPNSDPRAVVDDLLHYAVPLFVFISGALVWGRPHRPQPGAFRRFITGRASSIALPYLAWSAIYFGLALLTAEKPAQLLARAPVLLLNGNVWYHLYFVPMLLGLYLLTPLASRTAHRSPESLVLAAYVVRLGLWPLISGPIHELNWQAWSFLTHIATHLPHMALGAWFAVRRPYERAWALRSWPALLIVGGAALFANALGGLPRIPVIAPVVLPAAMAVTVLGFALCAFAFEPRYDRHARVVEIGALLSFGVYFVHPALLAAINATTATTGTRGLWLAWWMPVVVWLALCASSYAVSWALARYTVTSWSVGLRSGAGG